MKRVLISIYWRGHFYSRLVYGWTDERGKTRVPIQRYEELIADIGAQGDCCGWM